MKTLLQVFDSFKLFLFWWFLVLSSSLAALYIWNTWVNHDRLPSRESENTPETRDGYYQAPLSLSVEYTKGQD